MPHTILKVFHFANTAITIIKVNAFGEILAALL
jgi:hypothetical protein